MIHNDDSCDPQTPHLVRECESQTLKLRNALMMVYLEQQRGESVEFDELPVPVTERYPGR
jgi:hypothetical protein